MNFSSILNNYITQIGCSSKELAKASNLSQSTISRYCSGTRLPQNQSDSINKLIKGLSELAQQYNININEKTIQDDFNSILKIYDIDQIITNFNQLILVLKINVAEFSKVLGFDASYLSKIRAGKRKPADSNMFFEAICNYVTTYYNDDDSKRIISVLIKTPKNHLDSKQNYKDALGNWLCSNYKKTESTDRVNSFLNKLNDFDLNEYIRAIHFDDLKVPTTPFKIPKSKNYYGLEEMKQGELDFLKATVLAKSKNDVFMCSDMQMDDMSSDIEFGKKWMLGIAVMLKKGHHLNVIHNLDRSFEEMMIGLESWIPIYMTGQISSYYFSNHNSALYSHLNYVSNDIILTGECIKGSHKKGKYYLTNNKTEVFYYKEKSNLLLKKALPLMNIYRSSDINIFNNVLNDIRNTEGNRKYISSSLPIYTIDDDLLQLILKRNKINKQDTKKILKFVQNEKSKIKFILQDNNIEEIITKFNKYEFNKYPVCLELSKMFFPKKIIYNYDEYLSHFKSTQKYELDNNNYTLTQKKDVPFRNIQIQINLSKKVIISKTTNPTVHFIIEHPKLCKAIENFIVPITE